ncbi:MAG: DUF2752 domain-containing protein [Candidatus Hydrogenedentes bacterium]|nr:DUF2752 domain-containing protein [Candidatus Hydrogenedentota bacterium]
MANRQCACQLPWRWPAARSAGAPLLCYPDFAKKLEPPVSTKTAQSWSSRWPLIFLFILVLAWFYLRDPSQSAYFFPCFFHHLTGLYCPGCGGQRALHALLHGQVASALDYNVLAVPLLVGLVPLGVINWVRPQMLQSMERYVTLPGIALLAALALAFGVLRNLSIPLGYWLAP